MQLAKLFERRGQGPLDCSILYPAWNGAEFIRESLPSVLAQQDVRAEILVSDDCSDDASLDAIMELVAGYRGPHDVVVFKTASRAEFEHLPSLVPQASSDLLIQAHQDDVSYPERARTLLDAFRRGAHLATSVARWKKDGKVFPPPDEALAKVSRFKTFEPFLYDNHGVMIGSRFAMHADLFRLFPPLERAYLTGGLDILLPIRAFMLGEVRYIKKPLLTCGMHRNRWSYRLWDMQNGHTEAFGKALRRLAVFERALAELEQGREAGHVAEERHATLLAWLTRARLRVLEALVRAREQLVGDGFELSWKNRRGAG